MSDPATTNEAGPGWQWYLDRLGGSLDGASMPAGWDAYYTPELRQAYLDIATGRGSCPEPTTRDARPSA